MAKKKKERTGKKEESWRVVRENSTRRNEVFFLTNPTPTFLVADCFFQSCSQGARVTGKLIYYRVTVFPRPVFARISIHGATKTVRPGRTQSGRG